MKYEMNYMCKGKGKSLILIHGNGEDYNIFNEAIQTLQKHFTVYAIDLRGHGKSEYDKELRYSDMAEDLYDFIRNNSLSDPIICGYSDGAIVALKMITLFQYKNANLILCGVNSNPNGYLDNILPECREFMNRTKDVKTLQCMNLLFTDPMITTEDLNTVTNQTLLIFGEDDCIKPEHEQYLHNAIPNSKMLILDGENHESYICHSDMIAKIIINEYVC